MSASSASRLRVTVTSASVIPLRVQRCQGHGPSLCKPVEELTAYWLSRSALRRRPTLFDKRGIASEQEADEKKAW